MTYFKDKWEGEAVLGTVENKCTPVRVKLLWDLWNLYTDRKDRSKLST